MMQEQDQDRFEASLRQISPAAPPPELLARLRAARTAHPPTPVASAPATSVWPQLRLLWRALTVGAPAAALLLLLWLAWVPAPSTENPPLAAKPAADAVQVGHSLVASFDTIAQLPGGAPVRLRCREWQDDIVIHDHVHGVEVTQTTPRVEVIPIRFETY
jgi:anti-sigma-K factor RskA